jgi:general secretion pathway protein J
MSRRRQRGLTLIEMVLAITILSLILLLLYHSTYTLSRTARAVESNVEYVDSLVATHRILRRELSQLQPVALTDPRNAPVPAFSGHRDGMRWLAPLPVHRGAFGLYWLELSVEGSGSSKRLILEYSPMMRDVAAPVGAPPPAAAADNRVVLLENVERLDCRFLLQEGGTRQALWLPDWSEATRFPAAVRIAVERSGAPDPVEWVFPIRAVPDARPAAADIFEGA